MAQVAAVASSEALGVTVVNSDDDVVDVGDNANIAAMTPTTLSMDAEEQELFDQLQQDLMQLSPATIQRELLAAAAATTTAAVEPSTPERVRRGHNQQSDATPFNVLRTPVAAGQQLVMEQELTEGHRVAACDDKENCDGNAPALCAICLEPVDEVEDERPLVVRTNCRHEFHLACLKRNREFSNSCPMCRTQLARGLTPMRPATNNEDAPHTPISGGGGGGGGVGGDDDVDANGEETPVELRALAVVMEGIRDGEFPEF